MKEGEQILQMDLRIGSTFEKSVLDLRVKAPFFNDVISQHKGESVSMNTMKTISSQRPQSYDRSFHSQVVSEKGASFYKISDGKNSAIPPRKVLKPVVASTEESYIDERPAFRE